MVGRRQFFPESVIGGFPLRSYESLSRAQKVTNSSLRGLLASRLHLPRGDLMVPLFCAVFADKLRFRVRGASKFPISSTSFSRHRSFAQARRSWPLWNRLWSPRAPAPLPRRVPQPPPMLPRLRRISAPRIGCKLVSNSVNHSLPLSSYMFSSFCSEQLYPTIHSLHIDD